MKMQQNLRLSKNETHAGNDETIDQFFFFQTTGESVMKEKKLLKKHRKFSLRRIVKGQGGMASQ